MDLNRFYELFTEGWSHIEFEISEQEDEYIAFSCELNAEDYFENSIYVRVRAYDTGSLHVFLTFDEINATERAKNLINDFNENNPWFNAYITSGENQFLELHFSNICADDEEHCADVLNFALGQLLEENTLQYLKPLLGLTY